MSFTVCMFHAAKHVAGNWDQVNALGKEYQVRYCVFSLSCRMQQQEDAAHAACNTSAQLALVHTDASFRGVAGAR